MELSYKKNDNSKLFSIFNSREDMKFTHVQNYIPIYTRFFSISETNSNTFNLNHRNQLCDISEILSYNTCSAKLLDNDNDNNIIEKKVFFKFSPLLDPIKYLVGKYDISNSDYVMPSFNREINDDSILQKIHDPNNSSYVDGFFSFLSSNLLHNHGFIHGTDFYGSFLGLKDEFMVNIYDDLEYLHNSSYFCKYKNDKFYLDNKYYEDYLDNNTKHNRAKISIREKVCDVSNNDDKNIIDLKDVRDISFIDYIFLKPSNNKAESSCTLLYSGTNKSKNSSKCKSETSTKSSSSYSSRTSNTNSCDSVDDSDSYTGSGSESSSGSSYGSSSGSYSSISGCSTATEDIVNATLYNFPVEIIALEKCENTLDNYIMNENISDDELTSIVIQILMTLITYQKAFKMTHNDLHTNNIMYISTQKEFIYYKFSNKYYKVPTFGKIYKIIDFGRSIYHYKNERICSDSFHKDGDGATQYNCEPYFNKKKPVIEPNYSFDLCRLSCSLFDFFVEDLSDQRK